MRVAVVSSFPPRLCGIATFSLHLNAALEALNVHLEAVEISECGAPDEEGKVRRDVVSDYTREAERLNDLRPDVVLIQHEYGLFGGLYGSHLLAFVCGLTIPVVTVFHTVLPSPDDALRTVTARIASLSRMVVVMCHSAARLLAEHYGVDDTRVAVVPHGYVDVGVQPRPRDMVTAEEGRGPILLSLGLLGPNKGIDLGIGAMPTVLQHFPYAKYFVVGATHPGEIRNGVDGYRACLTSLAHKQGVERAVVFVGEYLSLENHVAWIQHSDLILLPHRDLRQASSGTLAFAVGSGRPVVCTPFAYAVELSNAGAGLVLCPRTSLDIALAIVRVLTDEQLHARLMDQSLGIAHGMTWPSIAKLYLAAFARL